MEAEGRLYRAPTRSQFTVSSGIDWFELRGQLDFEGTEIGLPTLLQAIRRGERTVTLGDGSVGLVPDEWLARFGMLAGLASQNGDHLRFKRSQAAILESLLEEQPNVTIDEQFEIARKALVTFDGLTPASPPPGFVGELRDYQCEGLAWLQFLERFGFGGCLADDMGLGKTVMVLAWIAGRVRRAPILVVVPRSLLFNWNQEAARFTPQLRVLDHVGAGRQANAGRFDEYDIILTTYGTVRRDVLALGDLQFDAVVLDEAQAIKNATTSSAKAVRLLKSRHRLALSGTPVENHLGELWSLFEFLNPGLLGSQGLWHAHTGATRSLDPESRNLLSRALRPFILRRTKAQVARELPAKTEQTIYCELDAGQLEVYRELRDHYRNSLLARVERDGMSSARMHVLEALLRLRQAACHPGLIDQSRLEESSAKLDVLLPYLEQIVEEGHKALVFSQFTSFLAIVRAQAGPERRALQLSRRAHARSREARGGVPGRS